MVQEYMDELQQIRFHVCGDMRSLYLELSKCDFFEQSILHYIESEKYDAVTGSKLLKALKENRQKRRRPKDELAQLTSLEFKLNELQKRKKKSNKNAKSCKGHNMVLSYLANDGKGETSMPA